MKITFFILVYFMLSLFGNKVNATQTKHDTAKIDFLKDVYIHLQPDTSLYPMIDNQIELSKKYPVIKRVDNIHNNTLLFIFFIVIFAIIAIIRIVSPDYFYDLWNNLLKTDVLIDNHLRKGKRLFLLIINKFFDFLFIASLTLLVYFYFEIPFLNSIFIIFPVILTIYLIQVISISIFFNVFFANTNYNIHLLKIIYYNRFAGIIIFVLLFLSFFTYPESAEIFIRLILVFLTVTYLIRLITNFFSIKRLFTVSIFYILLYLCVFEITLYLVILKEILQV